MRQGCALTAPGRLRRLTFGLGRPKYFLGRPAGRPADVGFLIYSQNNDKKMLFNRVRVDIFKLKAVPREFTCNIIIDFDRDKLRGFRF